MTSGPSRCAWKNVTTSPMSGSTTCDVEPIWNQGEWTGWLCPARTMRYSPGPCRSREVEGAGRRGYASFQRPVLTARGPGECEPCRHASRRGTPGPVWDLERAPGATPPWTARRYTRPGPPGTWGRRPRGDGGRRSGVRTPRAAWPKGCVSGSAWPEHAPRPDGRASLSAAHTAHAAQRSARRAQPRVPAGAIQADLHDQRTGDPCDRQESARHTREDRPTDTTDP